MLESSVEEFVSRYRERAATGTLYPQAEGSPLMEFSSAGRVLYLYDRSGPYAVRPGPARVIVHGVLDEGGLNVLPAASAADEDLHLLGVSRLEGVGEVLEVARHLLVVRARLPLVLGSFGLLPPLGVGDWVRFQTQAPLHGFIS
jgi:hypothetical protein